MATGSKKILKISFPSGWQDLDEKQLYLIFKLISLEYNMTDVKLLCLLRWSKIRIIGKDDNGAYLLRQKDDLISITPQQIAEALSMIKWLDNIPNIPIRISHLGRHRALPADFQEVPFEKFIFCDNLYQGFLATKNDGILDEMGNILYNSNNKTFSNVYRIGIFYWFASLKQFFAQTFPNFFQPTSSAEENLLGSAPQISVRDSMNAQIRALTNGDATKEKAVLSLDTWRALTELDAKAKEYQEFQRKYNK